MDHETDTGLPHIAPCSRVHVASRAGRPSFERVPYGLCIEGGRRGFLPEAFLRHYPIRGLIWEEDLYRSAVINELIADWTLSAFLTCP